MEEHHRDDKWHQRPWAPFVIVGGIVGIVMLASMIGSSSDDPPQAVGMSDEELAELVDTTRTVRYHVRGTAESASVTMSTPTGTEQAHVDIPMQAQNGMQYVELEFEVGDFVYISAQNRGEDGDVTCKITVEGETLSENVSTGAYSIVTCDGTV